MDKCISDYTLRRTNAAIALALTVFFFGHAIMGSLFFAGVLPAALAWVVWLGAAIIVAHVVVCCFTSERMLHDESFPPSARKKRHLALKWVTGGILLVMVAVHVLLPGDSSLAAIAIASIALLALTWHVCVCGKSLLKDVGAKTRWRTAFTTVIIVLTALVEAVLLADSWGAL